MKKVVRFIAQCIDTDSGDIMEEGSVIESIIFFDTVLRVNKNYAIS